MTKQINFYEYSGYYAIQFEFKYLHTIQRYSEKQSQWEVSNKNSYTYHTNLTYTPKYRQLYYCTKRTIIKAESTRLIHL